MLKSLCAPVITSLAPTVRDRMEARLHVAKNRLASFRSRPVRLQGMMDSVIGPFRRIDGAFRSKIGQCLDHAKR